MMNGTVKWFNQQKGFGFIIGEDKKEYFVHYSSITGEGFKTLEENQKVTFEITANDKGKAAGNVTVVA